MWIWKKRSKIFLLISLSIKSRFLMLPHTPSFRIMRHEIYTHMRFRLFFIFISHKSCTYRNIVRYIMSTTKQKNTKKRIFRHKKGEQIEKHSKTSMRNCMLYFIETKRKYLPNIIILTF